MKTIKQCLSLLIYVLLFVSNIYSQTDGINKVNKSIYKDFYTYLGRGIIRKHLSRTLQKTFFDSTILVDSIISTQVDGSKMKDIYFYNSNNNISLVTSKVLDNKQWIDFSNETLIYDVEGNITLRLYELWDGHQWTENFKETCTYDPNKRRTSTLDESWGDNEWVIDGKDTTIYDNDNGIFVSFIESWNDLEAKFDTLRYTVHLNYNDGSYTTLTEKWNNDTWVNYSMDTANAAIDTVVTKTWMDDQWINSYRVITSFNYTGNYVDEKLYEIWSDNQWINYIRAIYKSDSENNYIISGLSEIWENNEWNPVDFDFEFYTAENTYNCMGTNFNVYYNSLTAVSNKPAIVANYSLSQNYPNPFNPTTNIKYQIPNSEYVTIKLYDVLGKKISTLVNQKQAAGNYIVNFDASSLSSGVYYYQLKTENISITKKMLLLK